MRYAIIGARGQLGQELSTRLDGEVVALDRPDFDLTRPDAMEATLRRLAADVVINCAAWNLVDRAEAEPGSAFAVNAVGVSDLARICRQQNSVLVHFSTDYVFGQDTARTTPYHEHELPGPISVYGISKLAGEYAARLAPNHLVIRTCGLYGHGHGGKGGNFVKTMLRLADAGKPIRVVADQICTPTSAADLAEAVCVLLTARRWGLYHLTNSGACSWFDFARAIFTAAHKDVQVTPISSAAYGASAARPAFSVLANTAWQDLGLPPLRSWQAALADYLGAKGCPDG